MHACAKQCKHCSISLTKKETESLFPKIKQYFSGNKQNFNFEMLKNLKELRKNNEAV